MATTKDTREQIQLDNGHKVEIRRKETATDVYYNDWLILASIGNNTNFEFLCTASNHIKITDKRSGDFSLLSLDAISKISKWQS